MFGGIGGYGGAFPLDIPGGGEDSSYQEKKLVFEPQIYYFPDTKTIRLAFTGARRTNSIVLNGPYEAYYKNGQLKERGTFYSSDARKASHAWTAESSEDGKYLIFQKREGLFESYYESGKLKEKTDYVPGGTAETYYENGQLKEKGFVDEECLCSYVQESYYENGQLEKKEKVNKRGKRVGQCLYYRENGTLETKVNFRCDQYTVWESYYENGQLKEKGTCDKKGVFFGPYESYDQNGQLIEKGILDKKKRFFGPNEIYNKDGVVLQKRVYDEKNRYYTVEEYYSIGQLAIKGTCNENGAFIGPYESYTQDGHLRWKGVYNQDGNAEGIWENGQGEKQLYHNGKRDYAYSPRQELNEQLEQIDKQMHPSGLRQLLKRAAVNRFRDHFSEKSAGRKPKPVVELQLKKKKVRSK